MLDDKTIQELDAIISDYNHEDCVFHTINSAAREKILAWGSRIRRESKIEVIRNIRQGVTNQKQPNDGLLP